MEIRLCKHNVINMNKQPEAKWAQWFTHVGRRRWFVHKRRKDLIQNNNTIFATWEFTWQIKQRKHYYENNGVWQLSIWISDREKKCNVKSCAFFLDAHSTSARNFIVLLNKFLFDVVHFSVTFTSLSGECTYKFKITTL